MVTGKIGFRPPSGVSPAYAAPGEKLHASRTVTGPDGVKHTHHDRAYQGLPVLGGDVITHGD
ncbi:hypothetical protein ACFKCF_54605 [Nonomuraea sp. JJY05]